ncbi:sensor histidine kinase [Paenibacillus soyae]|uniref:Sensor histidine kinase n=1 Tax=Paenibacillus soyae TaxID=2969249 RepID=A0A9X2MPE2_9BACL|nr:sensor histidine kinase [Paenibacillus soyae]MCR2803774.1 sensor histidine kinase [Paenibacillus soyae]
MSFIYKLSFQQRIWLAFILIVSVVVSATGLLAYQIAGNLAENNADRLSRDMLSKTSQALDEKLNKVKTSVFSMMMNMDYRRAVGLEPASDFQNYYTHLSALQTVFIQMKLVEPLIDSILVATPEGSYYETSKIGLPRESFYATSLYDSVVTSEERHIELWIGPHEDPFYNEKGDMITFLTEGAMNMASDNKYVLANVKVEELTRYINRDLGFNEGRFILLSREGETISPSGSGTFPDFALHPSVQKALQQNEGSFPYHAGDKDYLVHYKRLDSASEWVLFSVLPKQSIAQQLGSITWVIIIFILVTLIISIFFARLLTRLLLRPLTKLQTVMKKVEHSDLDVRFESEFQDEISQVGFRFNRMLDEINRLFLEVKEAETEKRRSELKAMQAQIDPHFLYNTLNTIYWKSQLQEHEHVQQMVLSLSKLFQLGLNKGREMTTLKNEITHVTQYINIQKQCYTSLFDFRVDVQEGVDLTQPILKILLQPLVENSILHGFKDRKDGGFIHIHIFQFEDRLVLEVEDNGVGFEPAEDEDGARLSGYALQNIHKRLALQYGSDAELELISIPDMRTQVTIRIPLQSRQSGLGA